MPRSFFTPRRTALPLFVFAALSLLMSAPYHALAVPTPSHSTSFYESGAPLPPPDNGAAVNAVVPVTPFNTTRSFLDTVPRRSDIPLSPDQRALAAGAIIALGIGAIAFYFMRTTSST